MINKLWRMFLVNFNESNKIQHTFALSRDWPIPYIAGDTNVAIWLI